MKKFFILFCFLSVCNIYAQINYLDAKFIYDGSYKLDDFNRSINFTYEGSSLNSLSRGNAYLIFSPNNSLSNLDNVYVRSLGRWWPGRDFYVSV